MPEILAAEEIDTLPQPRLRSHPEVRTDVLVIERAHRSGLRYRSTEGWASRDCARQGMPGELALPLSREDVVFYHP